MLCKTYFSMKEKLKITNICETTYIFHGNSAFKETVLETPNMENVLINKTASIV